MNKCFTTLGFYIENIVSPDYFTGQSLTREEQIKRLESYKCVKGMSEKKQMELARNTK